MSAALELPRYIRAGRAPAYLGMNRDLFNAEVRLKREQEAEKEARERLIQMAQGRTTEGFGVRVIRSERVGSVDYKSIPELESVDLDQYRKPGSVYFQVREVK